MVIYRLLVYRLLVYRLLVTAVGFSPDGPHHPAHCPVFHFDCVMFDPAAHQSLFLRFVVFMMSSTLLPVFKSSHTNSGSGYDEWCLVMLNHTGFCVHLMMCFIWVLFVQRFE